MNDQFFTGLSRVGTVLGKGLIAGFAGTIAITISQMIEMQITGRGQSSAPMKVAGKVMGVEPRGEGELEKEKMEEHDLGEKQAEEKVKSNKDKFSQIIHFEYGTGWGVARSALDLAGVKGLPATFIHFGAIWGTALVMLPAAGVSTPVTKWPPTMIATDLLHHAVYAFAAGWVYDSMQD